MLERSQRAIVALLFIGGLVLLALGMAQAAWLFAACATLVVLPAAWESLRELLRGNTGVDLIAVLAMAAGLAMGEYLAAALVGVMLTGGEALESYAAGRARRELSALLARTPQQAHRVSQSSGGESIEDVTPEDLVVGDVIVVRTGELVPADGSLQSKAATLDESALTGESKPREARQGDTLSSGGQNRSQPFYMKVTRRADESTWAGIVRLVEAAQRDKAPFVRLADRYALYFLLITLAVCALAWGLSGEPERALAVLVVATPCPLILAAPTAVISGVSRAARAGIIVKGGAPMEALSRIKVLLLDKTGTLTRGEPEVIRVEVFGDHRDATSEAELMTLAASIEQHSTHPFASALVRAQRDGGGALLSASEVEEIPGAGMQGIIAGSEIRVGQLAFVAGSAAVRDDEARRAQTRSMLEGSSSVFVSRGDRVLGTIAMEDKLRNDAPRALDRLRAQGIEHITMVTGDEAGIAELVGTVVGVDEVLAERRPEQKVDAVRAAQERGPTLMVGDGLNDAPALALADVGVAMGARGAAGAAEAADMVLTRDRLDGLETAFRISKRTMSIALQSVYVGMGLSAIAMGFAAAGYLPPVAGALLQEGIDVIVILNALRALTGPRDHEASEALVAKLEHLDREHRDQRELLDEMGTLAGGLEHMPATDALPRLKTLVAQLHTEMLPHHVSEEDDAFPLLEDASQGRDSTALLARTHREIARQATMLERYVHAAEEQAPGSAAPLPGTLREELTRLLYSMQAVVRMHTAQEDEIYARYLDR